MSNQSDGDRTAEAAVRRVREFFDTYRTILMNKMYYGHRLDNYKRTNLSFEIILAVGTSSAVGSWAIWREGPASSIWGVIAAVVTIVAIVKPLLQFPNKIQIYTTLYTGLGDLHYDLNEIFKQINREETFNADMELRYDRGLKRLRELQRYDEPKPRKKLLRYYYEEVKRQLPPESIWMPEPQTDRRSDHAKHSDDRDKHDG